MSRQAQKEDKLEDAERRDETNERKAMWRQADGDVSHKGEGVVGRVLCCGPVRFCTSYGHSAQHWPHAYFAMSFTTVLLWAALATSGGAFFAFSFCEVLREERCDFSVFRGQAVDAIICDRLALSHVPTKIVSLRHFAGS